ncbi:thioredoxin-disulfide reductase [Arcanobacterium haemolyticum]|uniref:Thioredoxin reductase n=1 Tax=Arcanobacterium haemolyticum (strain ATCC 9345 / DSM 20595 / CCM 5947 / CCUG 17215 / LMG 16163 / NBRC 15585 / NCTC 8452 / 11018) TaxID=644284 RepID=D7BLF8_ARCHD|nr:thioredoxin-disulfide reductase [Arcanobacterium haemolyticum]ADH93488.1 thioredoxin reductase [Arcanobacterium haemolyticum DSM 20595]QCX47475.1 thioredoxin-disulfide reductase [Arcanobacterium haemolyticum]SPT74543.1 Thioredoxin reductase [Arcanobacterium haemolyticum]SQH27473.1 Thioredoxin reductase [Arcanobacterium haemolyticum]
MSTIHDVIIVGSGPAGWTAATYTGRAGLSPLVLAGTLEAGGALMNTTEVENFPGWPEPILGPELMMRMQQQAERFGAQVRYEDAISCDLASDIKTVTTADATYQAKTVILALGSEYRKLGLEGEATFSGKGVSYCATCDGFFFKGKEIAVVGGGDSAVTEAIFLSRFGSTVHVIHRRDELRASKVMANRIEEIENIKVHWNSKVAEIHGSGGLEALTLEDTVTGETSELPVSGLFVAIGHKPRSGMLDGQVDLDDHGYIVVDSPSAKTSLPGVFACGDVVDSTYQQAVTAAGTGCVAALDAEAYLIRMEAEAAAQ